MPRRANSPASFLIQGESGANDMPSPIERAPTHVKRHALEGFVRPFLAVAMRTSKVSEEDYEGTTSVIVREISRRI